MLFIASSYLNLECGAVRHLMRPSSGGWSSLFVMVGFLGHTVSELIS
jgi:hypothetical protein